MCFLYGHWFQHSACAILLDKMILASTALRKRMMYCRIFHGHSSHRTKSCALLCYTPRSTTHQEHLLNLLEITNFTMTRIIFWYILILHDTTWYYLAGSEVVEGPTCSYGMRSTSFHHFRRAAFQPRGSPRKLQHASGGWRSHIAPNSGGNYGELGVSVGFR